MIKITVLAAAAAATAALAACGSSPAHQSSPAPAPSSSAAAASSASPAPSPAGLTCRFVSGEVHTALHDLRVSNRHYQEAWASGGYTADLRALISVTSAAVAGANQLNDDAAAFSQDASDYLDQNTPYLAPGWQSGYRTVNGDIRSLAADCG